MTHAWSKLLLSG